MLSQWLGPRLKSHKLPEWFTAQQASSTSSSSSTTSVLFKSLLIDMFLFLCVVQSGILSMFFACLQRSRCSEWKKQVCQSPISACGHSGAFPAGPNFLLPTPWGGAWARGQTIQASFPQEQTEPLSRGGWSTFMRNNCSWKHLTAACSDVKLVWEIYVNSLFFLFLPL